MRLDLITEIGERLAPTVQAGVNALGAAELRSQLLAAVGGRASFDVCRDLGISCPIARGVLFRGEARRQIPMSGLMLAGQSVSLRLEFTSEGDATVLGCVEFGLRVAADFRSTTDASSAHTRALREAQADSISRAKAQLLGPLLTSVYAHHADWADTFRAWRLVQNRSYPTAAEEATHFQECSPHAQPLCTHCQRLSWNLLSNTHTHNHRPTSPLHGTQNFQTNLLNMQRIGAPVVPDEHTDLAHDHRRTLSHFA